MNGTHEYSSTVLLILRKFCVYLDTQCSVFSVQLVVKSFPSVYVERMLNFLAEKIDSSPHLEFYLHWCTQLLVQRGPELKKRSMSLLASVKNLQKSITQKQLDLGNM